MSKDKRRRRKVLFNQQNGKCCFCRCKTVLPEPDMIKLVRSSATVEHIVSKQHGGTDALVNLAMSCYRCNSLRGTLPYHMFLNLQLWKPINNGLRKELILEQQNKLTLGVTKS